MHQRCPLNYRFMTWNMILKNSAGLNVIEGAKINSNKTVQCVMIDQNCPCLVGKKMIFKT